VAVRALVQPLGAWWKTWLVRGWLARPGWNLIEPEKAKEIDMPSLGGWEWVILAVAALVLFGGTKLANFGKNAGKAIREFKEETRAGAVEPPATPSATQVDDPGTKA
jgi:sec-independent protein translocase protein TatA